MSAYVNEDGPSLTGVSPRRTDWAMSPFHRTAKDCNDRDRLGRAGAAACTGTRPQGGLRRGARQCARILRLHPLRLLRQADRAGFLPVIEPDDSLLASLALFGIGYVMRPIGGVIGAFADRAGRKPAMLVTIALMAIGMLMLAATPGTAVIGGGAR